MAEPEEYETPTLVPLLLSISEEADGKWLVTLSGDANTKVLYREKDADKAQAIFDKEKQHYESRKDEPDNAQG